LLRAYIGQSKVGAMTQDEFDAFSVEQWNKLKATEKRKLKKQGIENFQDYKRYLERNRKAEVCWTVLVVLRHNYQTIHWN
jgi:hypothetical protein